MVATKGTYIKVYDQHNKHLTNRQLNQLLVLIDPQHPPLNPHDSKNHTMCNRAKKFMGMKRNLNKRKNVEGIRNLEAEPPVVQNAKLKRSRDLEPERATEGKAPASAPNSPTKERPSQKPCRQRSPGRRQIDALRLDMSKMGADLADLKSKIKAQNKKGTAIEQEADKNTNLRLSAHFNALSGKPHAALCAFLLLGPVPINTTPRRCRVDNHIGFFICFCNCNNTQHATRARCTHTPTCNMQHAQQAAASCTNKAIL